MVETIIALVLVPIFLYRLIYGGQHVKFISMHVVKGSDWSINRLSKFLF